MRNITTAVAAVVVAGVATAAMMFGPARRSEPTPAPAAVQTAPAATATEAHPAAAPAEAHPGAAVAGAPKAMTAKECSIACTKKMNDMGMAGSCPESMCKPGVCPMMSGSHGDGAGAEAGAPSKP